MVCAASGADDRLARSAVTLLRDECFSCHGETKQKAGLSLLTRDQVLKGGEEGPVVQERRPKESRLLAVVLLAPKGLSGLPDLWRRKQPGNKPSGGDA